MIKNYLKTAWRNLTKRAFNSVLMLTGFACALTFALLIGSFILQERNINHELSNVSDQYLVKSKWAKEGMGIEFCSPAPLAKALTEQYPQLVKNYYSYDGIGVTVKKGKTLFKENIQPGSKAVLEIFGFPLLNGDAKTALYEPYTIVLPEEIAIKYFGKTDILDESISMESFSGEWREFTIKGVLAKTNHNSVLNYNTETDPILMSEESLKFFGRYESFNDWQNAYTVSFIEAADGASPDKISEAMSQLIKTNTPANINGNLTLELASLSDLHLKDKEGKIESYLQILTLVVAFLLILSMVNFINLSLGNASYRLKEIGMRKALGSSKSQAVFQILTESVILSLFAFISSLLFYVILRNYAGELLGRELSSLFELPISVILGFFFFALSIGILGGAFSAIRLASVSPILSLKNRFSAKYSKSSFKHILIGFQFAITLFVLGFGYVVSQQLSFLQSKNLGFAKQNRIYASAPRDWSAEGVRKMKTFVQEFENLPAIENATLSYEIPDGNAGLKSGIHLSSQDSTKTIFVDLLQIDENYFKTYNIPIISGKGYSEQPQNLQVILNKKAAELMGMVPTDPNSIRIQSFGTDAEVVAVCEDFNFGNLKTDIKPMAFVSVSNTNMYRYLTFQLGKNDVQSSISDIQQKWSDLMPNAPFDFKFIDDTIQKMYIDESRMAKAAKLSQFLVMIMVFLGIVGVVAMSLTKRKKELSMRRILGATSNQILSLFVREYFSLVLIASLVALPCFYFLSNKWLSTYAFSIDFNWTWMLAIVLTLMCFVASIVSLQSIRFLSKNAVESLKE
ncbi:putative ABC transport system permease protein [Spirosomataceae bacterium TFI 002]|nr:putative ABC transport system permease protein [Spirosomataceae bacterium TFI 002]